MAEDEFLVARRKMVAEQIIARGLREPRLLAVMERVPRHLFVPLAESAHAYADGPLPIGHNQTISQPYIVALMTDLLQLNGKEQVLEIGTGSGYQAAVLGEMSREVHTVELIPELSVEAEAVLRKLGYRNVFVHNGDGSAGWPVNGPYDGILVAAGAPKVPEQLLGQLAEGGRLVLPVGPHGAQELQLWRRNGREFDCRDCLQVAFVPLMGKFGWK